MNESDKPLPGYGKRVGDQCSAVLAEGRCKHLIRTNHCDRCFRHPRLVSDTTVVLVLEYKYQRSVARLPGGSDGSPFTRSFVQNSACERNLLGVIREFLGYTKRTINYGLEKAVLAGEFEGVSWEEVKHLNTLDRLDFILRVGAKGARKVTNPG